MMKLLSYHIENYGKIHDADGIFDEKLVCICEENGFGKTTLASFIKAMFYGLAPYTAASKTFSDRQHFYPFTGGKFGGNLTFEMEGKIYKIERFFDKKSNKGDECRVYCNGALFTGFGEDIGKAIFALDEESFQKTVFVTANDVEISSTHSINEKLNRTVEGGEDSFENAVAVLEKAKKELRAARGNNDLISLKRAEIVELTGKIRNLEDMSAELSVCYIERERLTQELNVLQGEARSAGKWETYDSMAAQEGKKAAQWEILKEKYPQGLPGEEERAQLQNAVQDKNRLQHILENKTFGDDKENKLSAYSEKFRSGLPTDSDISDVQTKLNCLTGLKNERAHLQEYVATEKETRIAQKFTIGMPAEENFSKNRALIEEYKQKNLEVSALSGVAASKKQNKANGAILIFACALLLAGIALFFVQIPIGVAVTAISAVLFVVAFVLKRKNGVNPSNVQVKLVQLQAEMRAIEEKIREFTIPYGYYSTAGAIYDFTVLEEDVCAYREYIESERVRKAEIERITVEITKLNEHLSAFFIKYKEEGEYQNALNHLTASMFAYRDLMEEKQTLALEASSLKARLQATENVISVLSEKYGLTDFNGTMYAMNALELDCGTFFSLEKELQTLRAELSKFKEENALTERTEKSADDLQAQLAALQNTRATLDKQIEETERFVERLNDYRSDLERAKETLENYQERYERISDTLEALKEAEQLLKNKYVAPIQDRFNVYATAIESVLNEKVSMDKDFRIVYERGGEARSEKHLSAGERSICALCLRLALIDNMYEKEQPFILLDDPFVHLDAAHMTRAVALLKVLSEKRQILYFCCHKSRSVDE